MTFDTFPSQENVSEPNTTSDTRLDTSSFTTVTTSSSRGPFLNLPFASNLGLLKLVPVVLPRVLGRLASVRREPSILLNVSCDGSCSLNSRVRPWR